MSAMIATSLEEVIQRLRLDPGHPVEAIVGDLRVEVRIKAPPSAADLFHEVGPWEGEYKDEPRQKVYPLRGTSYRFDEPTEPVVAPEEWEALR